MDGDRDHYQPHNGVVESAASVDLEDPALYINREFSWLDFNDRVLQLAEDERVPLLERVKFCAIYTTNLDEYYMVRVAGLHDQIDAGVENPTQDGRIPSETIALIRERVLGQGQRLSDCFERQLRPALSEHDIRLVAVQDLDEQHRAGARAPLSEGDLPRAHAARGRTGPSLPIHLKPVFEPRRARTRPEHRADRVRTGEGSHGDPAALRHAQAAGAPSRRCWSRSRTSSPTTSTRCSRAWRSPTTTSSG